MEITRLFTQHPASVGETYLQHLRTALSFGFRMVVGGIACLVHSLLPFMFVRTASQCIEQLHDRMVMHRSAVNRAAALRE